jgi:hypothetical protein
MPFVHRNWKGEITGLSTGGEPGAANEILPDNNDEIVAFRKAHPVPEALLKPLSPSDIVKHNQDQARIQREHEDLRTAIWAFNQAFSNFETALSALLYAALHLDSQGSHIPYVIYYSPTGFETRSEIVDNVVKQLIYENGKKLGDLLPLWATVRDEFRSVRDKRNKIAHGMPITLAIRGKNHVRLTAPPFDQIRVGSHIRSGRIPGLTASDILDGMRKSRWLRERIDDVNRLLETFHEVGNPTLPEKFAALRDGLTKSHSP